MFYLYSIVFVGVGIIFYVLFYLCVCNGVWVVVSLLCGGPICLWLVGCGPVLNFLGYGM